MNPARFATAWSTLVLTQAAFAHPGHVHLPGPVHGYSWVDLVVLLVAVAALPAIVGAWPRARRPGKR